MIEKKMTPKLFILILAITSELFSFAQSDIDTAAIKKRLELILDRDQKTRVRGDSISYTNFIDSTNLIEIESMISKYGWPGESFVGAKGNNTVFLVIQHSDLKTQEKYLPLLEQSVKNHESRASDLALLRDRILMRQNKKQIYGSQIIRDEATGGWKFYSIEDEKNVNIRRKEMGLGPIEEYAKHFGIVYKLSQ